MASLAERLAAAQRDVERLRAALDQRRAALANGGFAALGASGRALGPAPRKRRVLAGHFNKVYALDWAGAGSSDELVSASQDGKLMLWNARTRHKLQGALRWTVCCQAMGELRVTEQTPTPEAFARAP